MTHHRFNVPPDGGEKWLERTLAKVLRHRVGSHGCPVYVRQDGFVLVNDVIGHLRCKYQVGVEVDICAIEAVVRGSQNRRLGSRFQLHMDTHGNVFIRATYGATRREINPALLRRPYDSFPCVVDEPPLPPPPYPPPAHAQRAFDALASLPELGPAGDQSGRFDGPAPMAGNGGYYSRSAPPVDYAESDYDSERLAICSQRPSSEASSAA
eukprot:TRINITY_DN29064_c0_g1_i1.p1 TRINITY_DN29064_c0_g1~~TRINITY_DN29064_c0_g1_i1.p1  ORF type:complete len:223 (-),score=18.88 TRINITY_DN29064_c0_g1_i1:223-852(-)